METPSSILFCLDRSFHQRPSRLASSLGSWTASLRSSLKPSHSASIEASPTPGATWNTKLCSRLWLRSRDRPRPLLKVGKHRRSAFHDHCSTDPDTRFRVYGEGAKDYALVQRILFSSVVLVIAERIELERSTLSPPSFDAVSFHDCLFFSFFPTNFDTFPTHPPTGECRGCDNSRKFCPEFERGK